MVANENFNLNLNNDDEEFVVDFGETTNLGGGGGGTSNFNELTNRPKYNNVTMTGATNIPKVPTKTSDLTNDSQFVKSSSLAAVATSGDFDDLTDKPTIPTKTSQLSNDSGYVTSSSLATVATTGVYSDLTGTPTLATVATSGSYDDLSNKPTIPAAQVQSDWGQTDNSKVDYIKNKPTIPTVNDATLTITQNGTSKGTFTANDADDTTIEVSDTTYSNFTGTDGSSAGAAGLVPAPATTDAGKFLKADGTWDTAGGGSVTPVQTTGTSTTDVMSQNATTTMVYPDITNHPDTIKLGSKNVNYTEGADSVAIGGAAAGSAQYTIAIGANAVATGNAGAIGIGQAAQATKSKAVGVGYGALAKGTDAVSVGTSANTTQAEAIAIGHSSRATSTRAISVGYQAATSAFGAVALGANSSASNQGEVNIGSSDTNYGYNSSNYRLISGVYDPQTAHDAATKGYVDGKVLSNAGAPTTATEGTVGQLLEDTTNGKLYQCTAVTPGTDPDPDTYTWTEVGAGGGGPTVVQTTGTSTTDVMSQNATTSMICSDPSTVRRIQIGDGAAASHNQTIAIGRNAKASYTNAIAIGYNSESVDNHGVSIGNSAKCPGGYQVAIGSQAGTNTSASITNTVALGSYSKATRTGEVNVGTPNYANSGFNNTSYRVIGGVHDGQEAHDAVTVGQVNSVIDAINTALSTNIPHIGASS